jgi:sucrose-6-phosphate hydrolase SacC (GH32 family)
MTLQKILARSLSRMTAAALLLIVNTSTTTLAEPPRPTTAPAYAERYRPQFHFTSSTDWINDPNGLVFLDGEYHLFFQRVPGSNDGNTNTKSWGHAISTDLVHWRQRAADALLPDAAGSIWSGSAVVDWKNTSGFGIDGKLPLVAAYTNARDPFDQRLAWSTDRGRTWTKVSEPILRNVHAANRDPKIIWHEPTQRWIMALYLDRRSHFALYDSPDLKAWTKLQDVTLDGDDECPDFFPLNLDGDASKQKWIYTGANGRYVVGSFDGRSFTPESDVLDSERGPGTFYAAQTYSDVPAADGRRIQIGWLRNGRYPDMPFNQQLSFPCELTLRSTPRGPRLHRWPVREIASLYGQNHQWRDAALPADRDLLNGLRGDCFDVDAEIEVGSAREIILNVRGMPIAFRAEGTASGSLACWDRRATLAPLQGRIKLRVLVDRTSIEIFASDGALVMSGCFLPADDQKALSLTAHGGAAKVVSLTIHELKSAWSH